MNGEPKNPEMAEPMKMVKVSEKNFNRLVVYGHAGESVNTALGRVLDIAEQEKKKEKK